jgi:adenosylcobinamide hydrolase
LSEEGYLGGFRRERRQVKPALRQFDLVANQVRMLLKGNVIALVSQAELSVVSGAIHNGGFRRTRAIVNAEVPDSYGDRRLHDDPIGFVSASAKELDVPEGFVGMVTAAKIRKFSLILKHAGGLAVSVVATAGCSHAESAGEKIDVEEISGTINVIVLVDGDPTESCLVALFATAVEAKAAAMRELDIRSRYTGDAATGTITDSVVVAATNRGGKVVLGGPASELGQLVGACVRQAVREAINNQGECFPNRSVGDRLRERHLPVEKLASELSKVEGLRLDEAALRTRLSSLFREPFAASVVLAAVKLDEDFEQGLVAPELGDVGVLAKRFGGLVAGKPVGRLDFGSVGLSPFLREVLVALLTTGVSATNTENLK